MGGLGVKVQYFPLTLLVVLTTLTLPCERDSRSRRSVGLRTVGDMLLHACAYTSPFKQLRDKVVQSKRILSFTRELSHNSP